MIWLPAGLRRLWNHNKVKLLSYSWRAVYILLLCAASPGKRCDPLLSQHMLNVIRHNGCALRASPYHTSLSAPPYSQLAPWCSVRRDTSLFTTVVTSLPPHPLHPPTPLRPGGHTHSIIRSHCSASSVQPPPPPPSLLMAPICIHCQLWWALMRRDGLITGPLAPIT